MPLSVAAITGRFPMPNNVPPSAAEVAFQMIGFGLDGANVIPFLASARYQLTATGELPAGAQLWRNAEALGVTHYLVSMRWRNPAAGGAEVACMTLGRITVGPDASYDVPALLAAYPAPP